MKEDVDWDNGVLPESQEHPPEAVTVAIDPLRSASELAALLRGCKVRAKRTKSEVQILAPKKNVRTDVLGSSSHA